jgi:hypothetical protein
MPESDHDGIPTNSYFRFTDLNEAAGRGGRGFTPINTHTNQLHGDTFIGAETGKKLPV